ncbi:MAG: hypothetical protein G8237_05760 [Magnetococcales bacterium]|nr:hypothetical protein [Magnetococcales bacterium]NGZ05846.1 hypothetical protein [Magnetococcales bacterium]
MSDWILALLNHAATAWLIAALFPLVALARWWPVRQTILAPLLDQIQSARAHLDTTPETPAAFYGHFPLLETAMEQFPDLRPGWNRFAATLLHGEAVRPVILHTQRPEQFLHTKALLDHHLPVARLRTLPTILAGSGLFCTFIGLLIAWHYAVRDLTTHDPETSRQALQTVLAMAGFKLLTSMAGFASAWAIHWRLGAWHHQITRALHLLCTQLETRLEYITPEQLQQERHTSSQSPDALLRLIREIGGQIRSRLDTLETNLLTTLATRPAPLVSPETIPATPHPAIPPESWQPLIEALRTEGRLLIQELGQHLTQEWHSLPVPATALSAEPSQPRTRSEQESWMRIIDRLESASHALEKQSASLNGLSALAEETRKASESSIRAGREAVETLVVSVEDFNHRMAGTFARSAENLLTRLAHNNQQVVSQVIAQLDREQEDAIVVPDPEQAGLPQLFDRFLRQRSQAGHKGG